MIKPCALEPPIVAYQHSKKILLEKHGNPYHVIVEYRKKKVWPIKRNGYY